MKFSDDRQLRRAKEKFEEAMYVYNKVLSEMPSVNLNADDYNQLARQMNKLANTLGRIKERGENERRYQ